jgi:hypothetical protein
MERHKDWCFYRSECLPFRYGEEDETGTRKLGEEVEQRDVEDMLVVICPKCDENAPLASLSKSIPNES